MKECCCVEECHCLHPIVFNASAQATGYAKTSTGDLVTATATASANSYISQEDAFQNAYFTALQNANIEAQNSANIIDQTLEIVETEDLGIKGATGSPGNQGATGAQGATGPGLSTINKIYPVAITTPAGGNMILGSNFLNADTTIAINNTSLGVDALTNNTTGYQNVALGTAALLNNTTGFRNTATGNEALYTNSTGSNNVATGFHALYNTIGSFNVATGINALRSNTTGSNNTALGYSTGSSLTTGSNVTCIGSGAQPYSATASNQIVLGTSTEQLNIQGGFSYSNDFISDTTTITFPPKQFYIVTVLSPTSTITLPVMANNAYYLGTLVQFRKMSGLAFTIVASSGNTIINSAGGVFGSIEISTAYTTVSLVYAQYGASSYAWVQI